MTDTSVSSEPRCSIARTLQVIGEKWSLLIVRSAFQGDSRYSEFRDRLGIPTDVLAARLHTLVDAGVLERRSYREPGARERSSYHLTDAGYDLKKVLAALNEWGDDHRPTGFGTSASFVDGKAEQVRLEFVSAGGAMVRSGEITMVPGPATVTPDSRIRMSAAFTPRRAPRSR